MSDNAISRAVSALAETLAVSTVALRSREGGGAGVVWSADGTIVTNAHVVRGREIAVTFDDGREARASLERHDAARDLAILRVDAGDLIPAPVRDASDVRAGELLLAIGYPHGSRGFSTGIAHASSRRGARFIAADVRLAPGNSGGPLADAAGRVVGINTMVAGDLALAIPSDAVAAFVGRQTAPHRLGIRYTATGAQAVPALVVLEVEDGSLAERAGLLAGDCILSIDGTPVERATLRNLVAARALNVRRGARSQLITIEREANDVAA